MRSLVTGSVVLVGCLGVSPAVAGSTSSQRTEAQNHQAATRDAFALLKRAVLPSGAVQSSTEPSGDGGLLNGPALGFSLKNLVDEHTWWTVSEGLAQVFKFVQANPPQGATPDSTCGGGSQKPASRCASFRFSPIRGVLGLRELEVGMVHLGYHSTGIRVDTVVQWMIPRPAGEKVPPGATVVHIVKAVPGQSPLVSLTVTDPSTVQTIIGLIDRLQTVQPGVWGCPRIPPLGPPVPVDTFSFRHTRHGPALARAIATAGAHNAAEPCDAMAFEVRGHSGPAWIHVGGFLQAVQRLLGVRLTFGG
jgi:hypothetical protein